MACQDFPYDPAEEDDWLFNSTMRYETLHMFDLPHPVKAMDWINDEYIGVGTLEPFGSNDILVLCAPDVLEEGGHEGHSHESDLRVCAGALHERPFAEIQSLGESRLLLTSEYGTSCVTSWRFKEVQECSIDVIEKTEVFTNQSLDQRPAKFLVDSTKSIVVFGTLLSNATIQHIGSASRSELLSLAGYKDLSSDSLSRIMAASTDVVALCTQQMAGAVLVDVRTQHVVQHLQETGAVAARDETWTSCIKGTHCISVSSHGKVLALDTRRGGSEPLVSGDVGHVWRGRLQESHLQVQISPHNEDIFSISGLDATVRVYALTEVSKSGPFLSPMFEHDGHKVNASPAPTVFNHIWHPSAKNVVTSSDSDGGLHSWKWKL